MRSDDILNLAQAELAPQIPKWSLAHSSIGKFDTFAEISNFASSESASWYIVPECPEPRQTAMKKAFDISSALAKWRW